MQKCRDKCGQINLGLKLGPKWVKSNFFDSKCNQIRPMNDRNSNISICHSTSKISFQVENSLSLKMTLKSSSADDSRLEHQIRWGLFYLRPDSLCYPNALDVWIEGEIKMKIILKRRKLSGSALKLTGDSMRSMHGWRSRPKSIKRHSIPSRWYSSYN